MPSIRDMRLCHRARITHFPTPGEIRPARERSVERIIPRELLKLFLERQLTRRRPTQQDIEYRFLVAQVEKSVRILGDSKIRSLLRNWLKLQGNCCLNEKIGTVCFRNFSYISQHLQTSLNLP